jgi:hypothetical protein
MIDKTEIYFDVLDRDRKTVVGFKIETYKRHTWYHYRLEVFLTGLRNPDVPEVNHYTLSSKARFASHRSASLAATETAWREVDKLAASAKGECNENQPRSR